MTTASGVVAKRGPGRPPKQIDDIIDIDNLPTRFQTAEELRGYILHTTNGGRLVVDELIRLFKSNKTSKALKRDFGKVLLELIQPEKGAGFAAGWESPDGKYVFKWMTD